MNILKINKDYLSSQYGVYSKENKEFYNIFLEKNLELISNNYDYFDFPINIKIKNSKNKINKNTKSLLIFIIDCEKDSKIKIGFNKKINSKDFENSKKNNQLKNITNELVVKKNDSFFIDSNIFYELENNITYLEIEQVNEKYFSNLINEKDDFYFEKTIVDIQNTFTDENIINPTLKRIAIDETLDVLKGDVKNGVLGFKIDKNSYHSITFLEANGYIEIDDKKYKFEKFDTFLIPPQENLYFMEGSGDFLISTLPHKKENLNF